MKPLTRQALRLFNVLIVVSLLLGAVGLAGPQGTVVGAAKHPTVAGEQATSYVKDAPPAEPPAANVLAVVDVFGPQTLRPMSR